MFLYFLPGKKMDFNFVVKKKFWTQMAALISFCLCLAVEKSSLGVRVFNFNSTIFWRQADFCSLTPTQFSVYYKLSELSGNWTRFYCKIKKESSKDFSCEFLTCAVIQDRGYDVQIRINGADGQLENSLHFVPSLESRYFSQSSF